VYGPPQITRKRNASKRARPVESAKQHIGHISGSRHSTNGGTKTKTKFKMAHIHTISSQVSQHPWYYPPKLLWTHSLQATVQSQERRACAVLAKGLLPASIETLHAAFYNNLKPYLILMYDRTPPPCPLLTAWFVVVGSPLVWVLP
jgi:hypothetical protein